MKQIKLISAMLMLFMLCSCYEEPDGVVEVNVVGWKVPAIVLVSEVDSFECKQLREISRIIFANKKTINEKQKHNSGYYFIDYKDRSTSFRSYFRPELVVSPDKSTFLFCSGVGKPYEHSTCGISSVQETYCYDFSVENKSKTLESFDIAISAVDSAVRRKRNEKDPE